MLRILIILFLFNASIVPALAKESIILAFNLQGVVGVAGQIVVKGAQLAHLNLPKGLQDQYELIVVNFEESLDGVKTALEAEIIKKRPIAILGAVSSNQAFMINAISFKEKIPFITPLATHPDVTKSNPYAIRTCFDDNLQAAKLANFIYLNQKLSKGLILYNEKQSYAIGVKNSFSQSFRKFPGSKIENLKFTSSDEVKNNLLPEIGKINPDFILLPSYQTEAANIISIISQKYKNIKFYGTDSWGGGRLFHSIISGLPYPIEAFYVQHWSPENKNKQNVAFIGLTKNDAFLKQYNSAAMLAPAAVGYDALNFLVSAHQKFNAEKKAGTLLHMLKNMVHEGISGRIHLEGAQTPSRPLFIYKIFNKGEKYHVTFP